jgi:nucleoside-diphosphate-sugar epimerase
MASKRIVLVTGANGYIAGPVIEAFLKAGYAVRGTVRSKASANALVEALSQYKEDIEIVEVPDIVAPGAFDDAVKGVHGIAHLATPVSLNFTDPEPVLKTAIGGTQSILESALKETSIKSFVLMSSVAAVTGNKEGPYRFTEADWNDDSPALVKKLGKNSPGPLIYAASKAAAERAFWDFRTEKKPAFTMTAINPTFVMGPPVALDSIDKIGDTNSFIWTVFSGQDFPAALKPEPSYVDVRDIGRVAVFGVDHGDKVDGERFLLTKGVVPPQAAADILREAYPDRRDIIKEGTPGEGYLPGYAYPEYKIIDGSKAVKVTGQDYYSVEQTIIDTAKFLEKFL